MTHIPHNIANHLPDPKTPWKISPQLFNQLLPSDQSPLFKQVVVCPSDPEYNFIFQYFCAHPPEGYGISKVYCIHNPSLLTAFEAELQIMEQETSKFPSQWEIEPQADERRVAFQTWKTASQHFPSTQLLTAKETFTSTAVLPLWHGSSPAKSSSICSTGFTYFGKHHFFYKQAQKGKISSTDQGYFGSGIYFTSSAKYASRYADGNLLLAWTSMRPPYPVISDVRPGGDPYRKCSDMEMLEGKGAYQTYNAHYVPVASIFPNDPSCMIYHPCYPGQLPDCDELVVFNRSQALPCFWVQISIATPAHSLPDYSPILVDADPKGLQQWIKEDRKRLYETNSSGETLWQTAIREGQLAVLQWLHIQDPSMLHKYDEEGSTLMHLACALGQLPIARWMMERNADLLKVVNKEQWTPLHLAAFNEHLSILDSFFHHLPKDLLLQVASRPCCKALSYLLDRRVALPVTPFKQTLLHVAAQTAQEENVIVLLKYGLDLEERDLQGRTPLFLAAVQGHRGIIQRLLSQGARLDRSSNEQETVLHLASFYGYAQILDDLLKDPLGLKLIHVQDSDGKTPLHRAAWGVSKPTIVKMLLDHGADPNVLNKYDYTPLHWAAKHGHLESARILLERGANLSSANTNQDTPMDLALRWGQDDLVRLFIDPSRAVQQEVAPSSIQDPEGYHYDQFEKAYEVFDPFGQIFHLEKMADLFLLKNNYMQAAHILNAAYAIAKKSQYSMSYQQLIQSKLERIEALFLQDFLQIKTLFNHRGYIAKHQKVLETIRLKTQELMAKGLSIQEIQGTLTEGCKNLLIALITESIELIGEPPPPYAVFSLGSMARQEMCPYSDVEFGFFIEKNTPENKKYFRKLTKLIELKITNLGETKFPLIRPKRIEGIMSEGSSLTPSGFSMDIGGLSPLGRKGVFELIGTPDELAQFQTEEWLKRNDAEIILVNAMTRPGFLMGDQRLLDKYETHLHKILDSKIEKLKFFQKFKSDDRQRIREKRVLDLLIGYVTEFEPRLDLDKIDLRGFDVKRELYRLPHTVINALALYHDIPQKNTLEQLDALTKKKIFGPESSAHLKKLLTQAVHWRVETHLFYKTEKEIFYTTKEGEDLAAEKLFPITSEIRDTLQEMYRTLYPLHRATKAFTKGNLKAFKEISLYDPDIGKINRQHEEDVHYFEAESSHEKALALDPNSPEALQAYGRIKAQLGESKEALKYHQERLLILKRKHGDRPNADIATTLSDLGSAYYSLGEHSKAIEYHTQALAMYKEIYGDKAHPFIAISLGSLGSAYYSLGEYSKAIVYFTQGLAMEKEIYGSKAHPDIAISLGNLGSAYYSLGEHSKAIEYHTQSLAVHKEIYGNDAHPTVANSLAWLRLAREALEKQQSEF